MNIFKKTITVVRHFFSRFKNQVIAVFSLTIIVVISLTVFLFYNSTISLIKKDAIGSNKIVLNQINKNFAEYVKTMQDFSLNLRTDERASTILESGDTNYSDQKYISDYIKTMFYSRQDISNISLYILANKKCFTFSKTNRKIVISTEDITGKTWLQLASSNRYYTYLEPRFQASQTATVDSNLFTVYRAIINVYTKKAIAVVAVTCDCGILEDIINDVNNDEQSMICLMDSSNHAYYVNDNKLLQPDVYKEITSNFAKSQTITSDFPITIQGKKYLSVYNISDQNQWKIVKVLSLDILNKKTVQSKDMSLFILAVSIVFSVIIIMIIINALTSSLTALSKQMRLAGDGDFKSTIEEKGSYEIVMLVHRYNSMIHKIDELIKKNYISEINEKTARMRALEAQVDPHFLYNSLQVISTKAIINKQQDIYRMIEALASTLRYSITEEGTVTVSQEVKHIQNYLLLLTARFNERLSVSVNMEEDVSNIEIPKISIYTMVENSVKHGLDNMIGQLGIKILIIRREDYLIVTVIDNGPGILPERLKEINKWLSEDIYNFSAHKHIGLRNLNQRIKILFGEDASLSVESTLGQGTETKMLLPISSEGRKSNVSSINH